MVETAPFSGGLSIRSGTDPASFLGRTQELELIRQLLVEGTSQLLTLVGPAGVGKTRLALEVATRFSDAFPDGVWFVDLTPLSDPAAVPAAIAQSLGLTGMDARDPLDRVSAYLHARTALLFLDNLEQILPAAPLLDALLDRAPDLKLLVTSREALHLRREQTLPIPPLALPDPDHLPPFDQLAQVPSVALFLQRARMLDPTFHLTAHNARTVAELVERLDGLPLAIELAATRTQLLSPQMLLERLGQRLSLLHWEAQDLPQRQQTLRAAIAWSYDLLSPDEQTLFRSLSVFVGGFTIDAADAIATGPDGTGSDVLESLASLVDKSLVQREDDGTGGYRFRLLESVREFALESVSSHDERMMLERAHAHYFLELAERAATELVGSEQREWFLRLEREHDNLRTTLQWLLNHGEAERALRLATALSAFWGARGYIAEGRRQLESALERAPNADLALRVRALSRLGSLLVWMGGEDERSRTALTEALDLARSLGDPETVARSLTYLGVLARHAEDWMQARRYLEEALTYWEQSETPLAGAYTILVLGAIELRQGQYQEATRLLEVSVTQSREIGDISTQGVALIWLVFAAGEQGDVARAMVLLRELFELGNEVQNRRLLYLCGVGAAWLLRERTAPELLGRLLGALQQLREMMGIVPGQFFYVSIALATTTEVLQARLGQETLAVALAEGRRLSVREMAVLIDDVLTGTDEVEAPEPSAGVSAFAILSPREQEVLRLMAEGLTNKAIARQLFVSEGTVKTHVKSVFNKLGVDSRAQAVAVAAHDGLLEGVTGHDVAGA